MYLSRELEYNKKGTFSFSMLNIYPKIGTIDSDLKYISLDSTSKKYDLNGLHCTLKNETVRNAIKKSSSGKKITIRGKITDVGEVLGYYFDAYEIVNK